MDVDSQVSITSFGEELIHRVCETFFAASKLVFGFLFGTLAVMALIGAALTYPMETACVAAAASFFSIISLRKAYKAGLELRLRSYAATGSSDYGFGLEIEGVTDLNGKMTALLKGREPQVFEVDGTYLERVVLEELTRLWERELKRAELAALKEGRWGELAALEERLKQMQERILDRVRSKRVQVELEHMLQRVHAARTRADQ